MSEAREASSENPVVLVVDDDEIFRKRLSRALEARGWDVHDAGNAEQTLTLAAKISPDLVLLDLKMPDVSGLDLIEQIKELDSTISIIMLTGYGSIATALHALKLGADHYLSKPVDAEQIVSAFHALHGDSEVQSVPATSVPSLARVEWEHIQRVLSDCSGNISQAAKLLGIHRRSLQRKLSKYPPGR